MVVGPVRSLGRDGVGLFYEEAGGDDPPVLLVHGWCCDHTYFAPQFEHFAGRGWRVVAVDLRGHGESDKPRQRYAMSAFSDDLAWLCERFGLSGPMVIGHSMGGIIAFDLAARYPELPSAVVMLDAVVLPLRAARSRSSWTLCAARATARCCAGAWPTRCSSRPTTRAQGTHSGADDRGAAARDLRGAANSNRRGSMRGNITA